MLWLVLLSPLATLLFLVCVQHFETWMLAAVPARARGRRAPPTRRPRVRASSTAAPSRHLPAVPRRPLQGS